MTSTRVLRDPMVLSGPDEFLPERWLEDVEGSTDILPLSANDVKA